MLLRLLNELIGARKQQAAVAIQASGASFKNAENRSSPEQWLEQGRALEQAGQMSRALECFQERVELREWAEDRAQHLAAYGEIDIALDTFPYNGTTTTCEALWMGVPVITLAGEVHMSRVGATLLASVGLRDLVATDADDYVQIAAALAHDPLRRRALRSTMRPRMESSPLLDHAGFTRESSKAR